MRILQICLLSLLAGSGFAQPMPVTFQSRAEATALLELYTSEGCSSCPPAETWLRRLTESPQLWQDFVPVAFHIDYWDRLGWRDPWSSAAFSERQKAYAAEWRSESVYTPEFVLDGREWPDWAGQKVVPKSGRTKPGVLTVSSVASNRWTVKFVPTTAGAKGFEVHAARLASGLRSDVKSGENGGRRLIHDFVVLTQVNAPLTIAGSEATGEFVLPRGPASSGRLALAVWITPASGLAPLQATGGWLEQPAAAR